MVSHLFILFYLFYFFSNSSMPSIKVTRNNVNRRFNVEETSSWEDVARQISKSFESDVTALTLTYVDDDDDVITISTIAELRNAMCDNVERFYLSISVDQDSSISDDGATEDFATTKHTTGSVDTMDDESLRAPSTLQKMKRIQGLWFSFLEENKLHREWDPKGPSIG